MRTQAKANTAATSEAVDPNVIAYPLDTCIVADKKLGSMGKPHVFVHEGRQFKYCCEGCDDEFQANTDKYIKKFDDAVAAKKAAEAKPAEKKRCVPRDATRAMRSRARRKRRPIANLSDPSRQ